GAAPAPPPPLPPEARQAPQGRAPAREAMKLRLRRPRVAVLDYGSGNLRSAERALARAGADVAVTADRAAALAADGLVVPGVGAFAACMAGGRAAGGGRGIDRRLAGGGGGPRGRGGVEDPVAGGHRARHAHRGLRPVARPGRAADRAGAAAYGLEHRAGTGRHGAVRRDRPGRAVLLRPLLRRAGAAAHRGYAAGAAAADLGQPRR